MFKINTKKRQTCRCALVLCATHTMFLFFCSDFRLQSHFFSLNSHFLNSWLRHCQAIVANLDMAFSKKHQLVSWCKTCPWPKAFYDNSFKLWYFMYEPVLFIYFSVMSSSFDMTSDFGLPRKIVRIFTNRYLKIATRMVVKVFHVIPSLF